MTFFVHLHFIDVFLTAFKPAASDDHFIYEDLKINVDISDIGILYNSSILIYDTIGCKISNMK